MIEFHLDINLLFATSFARSSSQYLDYVNDLIASRYNGSYLEQHADNRQK
jgi:hypothetical protein